MIKSVEIIYNEKISAQSKKITPLEKNYKNKMKILENKAKGTVKINEKNSILIDFFYLNLIIILIFEVDK